MSAGGGARSEFPFSQPILDDIRDRTPPVSLIGRTVGLKRSGRTWRAACPVHGGKGPNFSVGDRGYRCFVCAAHGDVFDWVMWRDRVGFSEAVRRLASEAGIPLPDRTPGEDDTAQVAERRRIEDEARAARRAVREAEDAATQAGDIAKARRLWDAASPIDGTLGERYLTEARQVTAPTSGWPACVRYHGPSRTLLVSMSMPSGEVRSLQRILLTPDGRNLKSRDDGRSLKLATGPYYGACGRLPGADTGCPVLLHGEGFETAASPWSVAGYEARIWFGGLASARLERDRINVILRDDDKKGGPAALALDRAMARWRAEGFAVIDAPPFVMPRGLKEDWNDWLRDEGPEPVRSRLAQLIGEIETPRARPSADMADIRADLRVKLRAALKGEGPAHLLLRYAMSSGKSQGVMEVVAEMNQLRAHFVRDHRLHHRSTKAQAETAADEAGFGRVRLRYVGEHHNMVADALTQARSLGLSTVHDGGFDRPYNPADPDGEPVCAMPERRRLTQAAGVAMVVGACGDPDRDGPLCDRRLTGCARWSRLVEASYVDVVGMTLERAFDHFLPKELSRGFTVTFIDEGMDRVAYATHTVDLGVLDDALFDTAPVRGTAGEPDRNGAPDPNLTAEARALYARLRHDIQTAPRTGPQPYVACTLTAAELERAIALTEARDWPFTMSPATSPEDRERLAVTSFRPKVRAICGILRALLDGPGRVSTETVEIETGDGRRRRVVDVVVRPLRTLHRSFVEGRLIFADWTANPTSIRRFAPDVVECASPVPLAPHQTVVHFLTSAGKYAMRSPARLDYLKALVSLYRDGDSRPGVITHLEHAEKFAGLGAIIGHFGALTSSNAWKNCSAFFNFGAPSLSPKAAAAGGAARTGEAVPVVNAVPVWQAVPMADGGTEWVRSTQYEHPAACEANEAVRERQSEQGVGGRPRAPNRTADDPVTTFNVGRPVVPHLQVDYLIRHAGQHAPPRFVRAVAAGLVVDSGPDRHRLHPTIYTRTHTAEYDRPFEVGGFAETLGRVLCPAWQPSGPRERWVIGRYWVDGRGHRRDGRLFSCPESLLAICEALLEETCRATEFKITGYLGGGPDEVTRTRLKTEIEPILGTYLEDGDGDGDHPPLMPSPQGDEARAPPDG